MLFNEPKLLKFEVLAYLLAAIPGFSALQRAEIAENDVHPPQRLSSERFSALQRAEIAEIFHLLAPIFAFALSFSALQRAEIAEIFHLLAPIFAFALSFSALQRAEIAEIFHLLAPIFAFALSFSALQRAEIAEIRASGRRASHRSPVSVLFNEPKLLKLCKIGAPGRSALRFSALQRAEIAEMLTTHCGSRRTQTFQCSSTSRNC